MPRTARYHTLGEVDGDWGELWYVLHGYGQLARRFLANFERVAAPERLIVAPEGLSRFYLGGTAGRIGASWMTREEREPEIVDYVAYLDQLHHRLTDGREGVRAGVLGFSQGTATALRWAVLGNVRPGRVILWGGAAPPDLDDELVRAALREARVDFVVGDSDEYWTEEKVGAELTRLQGLTTDPELVRYPGGHRLDSDVLARRLVQGQEGRPS